MIEQILHRYREASKEHAIAKAKADYLENFKKHLVCTLMKTAEQQGHKSAAAQEREAYASEAYLTHIKGLAEATQTAALRHHELRCLEYEIEVWRTTQANERQERRAYNA